MTVFLYGLFIIIALIILCRWYLRRLHSSLFWCWDNGNGENRIVIDTDDVAFPEHFLWGTAASSYQCEGSGDKAPVASNWSKWELKGIERGQRLYHFVHPLWFEHREGFLNSANVSTFVRFAVDMFKQFENECHLWCTINEPEIYLGGSYLAGIFPSGHKGQPNEASLTLQHLLQVHVEIYDGIKNIAHQPGEHSIGIVKALIQFDPWNPLNLLDVYLSHVFNYSMNECMLDFFRTGRFHWKMPGSINRVYTNSQHGIADRRHLFLRRYLYALSRAINEAGCDVRDYFYWSSMDNFEWAEGFDMKFGLHHVNLQTQERTFRDGAKYFQYVIQKHRKKNL